jgi:hypothetical protein
LLVQPLRVRVLQLLRSLQGCAAQRVAAELEVCGAKAASAAQACGRRPRQRRLVRVARGGGGVVAVLWEVLGEQDKVRLAALGVERVGHACWNVKGVVWQQAQRHQRLVPQPLDAFMKGRIEHFMH